MKKILGIILISCLFLSGCDDPESYFEEGYETGYGEGYDDGYDTGFNNGYITCTENARYELLTSQDIIEDALYYEDIELVQKLEEYYYRNALYGNFVGDSSTNLLHLTCGECFEKINYENLVLFRYPLESVLEDNIYTKCYCLNDDSPDITSYGTDYKSTWGDLIKSNGGDPVWGTLTKEQQALIHYPYFDKEKVYWTPEGKNYHAVDWCYTLERSKEILSGTYDEAVDAGLDSCSKCVGNNYG